MKWLQIAENGKYRFEIGKAGARDWYVRAVDKADENASTMAGFTTRKKCIECAQIWAGWMK